ncbi:hypothetical protein CJI54_01415, partial [Bifidobacteriaceae bacterium NR026]
RLSPLSLLAQLCLLASQWQPQCSLLMLRLLRMIRILRLLRMIRILRILRRIRILRILRRIRLLRRRILSLQMIRFMLLS